MRFRLRDLLLANVVVAICLTICIVTIRGSYVPPQDAVVDTVYLVAALTLTTFATLIWTRRRMLRKAGTVLALLPAQLSWRIPIYCAFVILLISFLDSQPLFPEICGATGLLLGYTFFSLIHSTVLVCEQGLFSQCGGIPWNKVAIIRDPNGLLQKLQIGKSWWCLPIDVPQEEQEKIERILAKIHQATTSKQP